MRWIVDAQLPPALATLLVERGDLAEHVYDVCLGEANDSAIWQFALNHGAIIVTKDEDFPTRALVAESAPVIVWIRIGNCSRRALLDWFAPLLPAIKDSIVRGESIVEVR